MSNVRSLVDQEKVVSCFFRSSIEMPYRKALLQITERCNLNCAHCFLSGGGTDSVPVDIIKNVVIPRLKKCRVIRVTLTGGEPFLHSDIVEIAHLFSEASMPRALSLEGIFILSSFS
jgi:MoaA/NifB/PqqE/SkfB family radical SAM enzyme